MVEIGHGELITDSGDMDVALLADLEQIAVAEIHSRPYCEDVPPAHMHRSHGEALYVVEGEIELRLEDGEHRVGRDTWVFVPPEVVHTIVVTGEGHTQLLDLHVPGSGFGDYVRGLHTAQSDDERQAVRAVFDQEPAPDYGGADPALVVIRQTGGGSGVGSTEPSKSGGAGSAGAGAETGEKITDRPGRRATLLVDAEELTVSEFRYGAGERGAKPHVHFHHADVFIVVDGEFTFASRDGSIAGSAGALFVFPPEVVHGFDNDSDANARCFNLHVPASGFADYLRGRNPDFDQHDPPADGGVDPASMIAVRFSG